MKRALIALTAIVLLASCSGGVPAALALKKETAHFIIHYPKDWKTSDGLGGGINVENANGTMLIPIGVTPDPSARIDDVRSIPEILGAFQKPVPGGKMWIKRLSGRECIWAESQVLGQRLVIVYVPLDGNILSIQMQPRKSDGMDVTSEDMQLAVSIIENMEIK